MTAGVVIRNSGSLNIQLDATRKSFSIRQKTTVTIPDNTASAAGYVDVAVTAVAPVAAVYSPNGFAATTVIVSTGTNAWNVRVIGTKGISVDVLVLDTVPTAVVASKGRIRNPDTGDVVFDFGAFYPAILGQGKYNLSQSGQTVSLASGLATGKYAVVTTQPGSYMIPVNPPPGGNFQYTGAFRSDAQGATGGTISTALWPPSVSLTTATPQGWMLLDVTSYYSA